MKWKPALYIVPAIGGFVIYCVFHPQFVHRITGALKPTPKYKTAIAAGQAPKLADMSDADFQQLVNDFPTMPPQEKEKVIPILAEIYIRLFDTMTKTSKPNWDSLRNETQIIYCTTIKTFLEAGGFNKQEASGFSMHIGQYMASAPPQVTVEDAIHSYIDVVNAQRQQRNMATLDNVMSTVLTGAQIMQALKNENASQ